MPPYYGSNAYSSDPRSDYLVLQYPFPWPAYDLKPPWPSAMAQAESSVILLKAHELTGDAKYLDTAKKLLNFLFVEVKDGGVTYKTSKEGWWYELYPIHSGEKEPRVLNGMLISVASIYDYYNYTHDKDAKFLFDKGILALEKDLSKYDYPGNYTYYDRCCGNLTPVDYQPIVVTLLGELYDITKKPIFKMYYDKWKNYVVPDALLESKPQPYPHLLYDEGVPILDYGNVSGVYIGFQKNPVTISHYAEDYFDSYRETGDEKSMRYFINCANWLLENSVSRSF